MQTPLAITPAHPSRSSRRGRLGPALLGAVALLATGCGASILWTSTHPAPREMKPLPADKVEVFMLKPPTRPFAEVGLIDVDHGGGAFSGINNNEVLQKGREFAGQKGCDAVVVSDVTNNFRNAGNAAVNQKGYQLTCIVWMAN